MADDYTYIIVGGGLAGASAVEGIRERDAAGSILLIGNEAFMPYERPPLTKGLWTGATAIEEVFVHTAEYYRQRNVIMVLGAPAVSLNPEGHVVTDSLGHEFHYRKLLLATGGFPRALRIPGGDVDGICYYRYLEDYERIRERARSGSSAIIIGGGFIGGELGPSLARNGVKVTMIFPDAYVGARVFPEGLGRALQERQFLRRGITVRNGERPVSFARRGAGFAVLTEQGEEITADMLIVGVGILPAVELAESAGLKLRGGVMVDEYLQTSHPDIYAAGDNAVFPYLALGRPMRFEHWDNAVAQGRQAGRNMAGLQEPYDYLPDFFSDLYDFSCQGVGEIDAGLTTVAEWETENERGTVYYIRDGRLNGVLFCNREGNIEEARELIRRGEVPQRLRAAVS